MTTNKSEVKRYELMGPASDIREQADGEYVSWDDYEALQAECEKLRKRARAAEREYSKVARTLKGLERVAKDVSDHSDDVFNENNQLRSECEKLRKDAETERAIQRAAEVLPPGFRIEIEIEKDYGGVALFSPAAIVECDFQGGLAEQIADAIDAAIQGANP